jgi:DNA-binding transcriptional MerR regulator
MQNLYSIDELAEKTGFSPRTIAYYIQMKLLPSIGRRGRKTKYPVEYLYRLQVIKRFKDKQNDNYLLMQYGLEDVAALLNCMTPEELKEYAVGKIRISEDTLKKILLKSSPEDKKLFRAGPKLAIEIPSVDKLKETLDLPPIPMIDHSYELPPELKRNQLDLEEDERSMSFREEPVKKTTASNAALKKELQFLKLSNQQLREENKKLVRKNRELKDKLDVFITHINEVIIRHK